MLHTTASTVFVCCIIIFSKSQCCFCGGHLVSDPAALITFSFWLVVPLGAAHLCNYSVAGRKNFLLHLFEMLQNLNFIFYLAIVNIWVSEFYPIYAGAYWNDIFKLEFSKSRGKSQRLNFASLKAVLKDPLGTFTFFCKILYLFTSFFITLTIHALPHIRISASVY